jgi:hypothetical protein
MSTPEKLLKLAELHRSRIEDAIIRGMFEASFRASSPVDRFVNWQLASKAAIAAFLVANADAMTKVLSSEGFVACSVLLIVSGVFGLYAEAQATLFDVGDAARTALPEVFERAYGAHAKAEEDIYSLADSLGVEVDLEPQIERVVKQFLEPQPFWARYFANRHLAKYKDKPYVGLVGQVKSLNAQMAGAFLQTLSLLGFFGAALVFAGNTFAPQI